MVDLENPQLVSRLFSLFHGTPRDSSLLAASRVAPASPAIQARLMGLFTKSIAAANCFPATFQVGPSGASQQAAALSQWLHPSH